MTIYDVGDKVTVTTTVLVGGQPTDDSGTTATVIAPDNTSTSPAPTHGATGQYSVSVTAAMPGNYLVRFTSPNAGVQEEQQFYVQPPGFRVISLTDAKNHINKTMTYTGDDNELRDFIEVAGELVDILAGPTVNRTVTEYHSGPAVEVFLNRWPVVDITSVTETWPGGMVQTLNKLADLGAAGTGFDYTFDAEVGSITRRVNAYTYAFPPGVGNIKVVYTAGRKQPWPPTIRMAAQEEVAYLWRTSQTGRGAGRASSTGSETDQTVMVAGFGAVPVRVVQLLGGKLPPKAGA